MQFEQIKQLSDEQVIDLFGMYQLEWWSQGRKLPDIRLMLEHSDEIVAFCDSNSKHLVAFARILTDYVYRATIFDVIVENSQRGQGLGKILMDSVVNHPALQTVESFQLYCLQEMIPFYQKWEFGDITGKIRFMILENSELREYRNLKKTN